MHLLDEVPAACGHLRSGSLNALVDLPLRPRCIGPPLEHDSASAGSMSAPSSAGLTHSDQGPVGHIESMKYDKNVYKYLPEWLYPFI